MGICLALCGQGDYRAVRKRIQPLFRTEARRGIFVSDFNFLPILAIIMAHEGHEGRAVELLSLAASQHPMRVGWMSKWALLARLHDDLEVKLGSQAFAAAWARGKRLDIETACKIMIDYLNQPHTDSPGDTSYRAVEILSAHELEILRLVADELLNREIAERLVLAISTVKWYVSEILSKLHVANRTEAVTRARELDLLT